MPGSVFSGARAVMLIGPMAAGKTSLGRHFARSRGWRFADVDEVIAAEHGSIPDLFREHGEEYFRRLEVSTVKDLLAGFGEPLVVSVGGGAPVNPGVQEALKGAVVVNLLIDLETVLPRIARDDTRPMLQEDPAARWSELYEARRATYEQLADITLDVRDRTIEESAHNLDNELARWEANHG